MPDEICVIDRELRHRLINQLAAFLVSYGDDGWFLVLFHLILSFQKTKAIRLQKISDSPFCCFGGQFVHLYYIKNGYNEM